MEASLDLDRLKAGDDAEWSRAERIYAPRLHAYAARRVRDRDACDDIVQESFLVAVRNIARVDPALGFEAYLFNIVGTRTIDWMRRRRPVQFSGLGMEESAANFDFVAAPPETPSAVVRRDELEERARALLGAAAREWCRESFEAGAFERVAVLEALLVRGVRNKDAALRFGHSDDTVVAGIKFRALKRIAELVDQLGQGGSVRDAVRAHLAHEERGPDVDFAAAWKRRARRLPAARLAGGSRREPRRRGAGACALARARLRLLRGGTRGAAPRPGRARSAGAAREARRAHARRAPARARLLSASLRGFCRGRTRPRRAIG